MKNNRCGRADPPRRSAPTEPELLTQYVLQAGRAEATTWTFLADTRGHASADVQLRTDPAWHGTVSLSIPVTIAAVDLFLRTIPVLRAEGALIGTPAQARARAWARVYLHDHAPSLLRSQLAFSPDQYDVVVFQGGVLAERTAE